MNEAENHPDIDARLAELGMTLPPASAPFASYVPFVVAGDLLFISGQLAKAADGTLMTGVLGGGLGVAEGQAAAKLCALNVLAQVRAALGSLGRVRQLARLTGYVASTPDFSDHPAVVNGASDLMVAVLGDRGRHSRVAVGVSSLPGHSAVEVDAIFALGPP